MLYQLYTNDLTGELYLIPDFYLKQRNEKNATLATSNHEILVGRSVNNRFVGKNITFVDYFLDLPLPDNKPIVMVPPPSLFTRVVNLYKEAIKEL